MPTLYPENTQYSSPPVAPGSFPNLAKKSVSSGEILSKSLAAYKKKKAGTLPTARVGVGSNGVKPSLNTSLGDIASGSIAIPVVSKQQDSTSYPLGQPFVSAEDRSSKLLPEGYDTFSADKQGRWVAPTDTAKITTVQKFLGGGQYIVDPASPGGLIKSERDALTDPDKLAALPPEEQARVRQMKLMMTGGNPDIQIDHIIPLWAGGANTLENMQPLRLDQHALKTKVQAVPLTLLESGVIGINDAKIMAQGWKDISDTYDMEKVPDPYMKSDPKTGEIVGTVNLDIAKKLAEEWGKPKGITLKDVLKAIPESRKTIGGFVAQQADKLPSFFSGAIKGFTTEATMGVIPQVEGPKSLTEQLGHTTGSVAGWLLPFAAVSKIVRGVGMAFGIKGLAEGAASVLKGGGKAAEATGAAAEAAAKAAGQTIEREGYKLAAQPWVKPLKVPVGMLDKSKQVLVNNIIKNATGLAAYGQLRTSMPTIFGDQDPGLEARAKQLVLDSVYGGMVGRYSQSFKDYAKLGGATLTLSLMEQGTEEHPDAGAAFTNAITMMALHRLTGAKKQEIRIDKKSLTEDMNKAADVTVTDFRGNILTGKPGSENPYLEYVKKGEALPVEMRDPLKMRAENAEMHKTVASQLKDGLIGEEEARILHQKINTSYRQLYKGGLVEQARMKADAEDLSSTAESLKKKVQSLRYSDPNDLYVTVNNMPRERMQEMLFPDREPPMVNNESTVGKNMRLWISGATDKIDPETANNRTIFFDGLKNKTASPQVLIVDRANFESMQRLVDSTITQKEIDAKLHKMDDQPWNHKQVYGIVLDAEGKLNLLPLGWVAKPFRIEGGANSVNNQMRKYDLPEYDLSHNANTLSDEMRSKNVKIGTAYVTGGGIAKGSEQPWMEVTVGDKDWQNAIEWKQYYDKPPMKDVPSEMNASQAVVEANNNPIPVNGAKAVQAIAEKQYIDPHIALNDISIPQVPAKVDVDYTFNFFAKTLYKGDATTVRKEINEKFGPILEEEQARFLVENKESVTTRDVANVLYLGVQSGKASPATTLAYKEIFIPFFKSPEFQASPVSSYFGEIPILGRGPKKAESMPYKPKETLTEDQSVVPGVNTEKPPVAKTKKEVLKSIVDSKRGPKTQRAESIYNDLYLTGEDRLSSIDSKDRKQYASKVLNALNNLDVKFSNAGLPKNAFIEGAEYTQIKKTAVDRLKAKVLEDIENKFDINQEIIFKRGSLPSNPAELAAERNAIRTENRKNLRLDEPIEEGKKSEVKTESLPERVERTRGALELLGKSTKEASTLAGKLYVKDVEALKNLKDQVVKTESKNSYAYGEAKSFNEYMTSVFGKSWGTRADLNSYFGMSTKKGQRFWGDLYKTMNEQGHYISQPKSAIKLQDKPYDQLTKSEKSALYAERRIESSKASEEKDFMKEPTAKEKEALEAGLSIQGEGQGASRNITDMTVLDKRSTGRMGAEVGLVPDAAAGARDARAMVIDLIGKYNSNVRHENKQYGKKKPLVQYDQKTFNEIDKRIKEEAARGVDIRKSRTTNLVDRYENLRKSVASMEKLKIEGTLPEEVSKTLEKNKSLLEKLSQKIAQ